MPPKRKASTLAAEPPLKRRTRFGHAPLDSPTNPRDRVLRSGSTSSLATEPHTPTRRRIVTTYGSLKTRSVLAQSLQDNQSDDRAEEAEDASDDPLAYNTVENKAAKTRKGKAAVAANTKEKAMGRSINDDDQTDSEDELMLSPTAGPGTITVFKTTQTAVPRQVLDVVEITTPSRRRTRRTHDTSISTPKRHQRHPAEPDTPMRRNMAEQHSIPPSSPTKSASARNLRDILPSHLTPCLNIQKRAILRALRSPIDYKEALDENADLDDPPANDIAIQQLTDLLQATISRGEGNSCLIMGPRGSGKSHLAESCISSLPQQPIIIRLSGWTEHNDRLAMREIGRQLSEQTGQKYHVGDDEEGIDDTGQEENPFLDNLSPDQPTLILPPPSHLPALISSLPTLSRPTIVILDAFDLFALHPRQALLYCLLDTVQSCRAGTDRSALAVIGVTSRVDTINHLEKRVKSRFSGRILRTAHPRTVNVWKSILQQALTTPIEVNDPLELDEWQGVWDTAIEGFLNEPAVDECLREVFSVSRDTRFLARLLTTLVLQLSSASPFPSISSFSDVLSNQRQRLQYPNLHTLSYPCLCLLIASMHYRTAGHEAFTFEMLYERFSNQVRASTAAPVQINGGSIGMVRCPRPVMMVSFEELAAIRVFVCVTPLISTIAKEFVKYRCAVNYEDLKKAIARTGHTYLKRWMNKPQ